MDITQKLHRSEGTDNELADTIAINSQIVLVVSYHNLSRFLSPNLFLFPVVDSPATENVRLTGADVAGIQRRSTATALRSG